MTALLSEAVRAAQQLPEAAQNELAQQILEDITSEIAWHHRLAAPELQVEALERLAAMALEESDARQTLVLDCDHPHIATL